MTAGVPGEELPGRQAQAVFKPDHVVGRQELIQVSAALIETSGLRRAAETEQSVRIKRF
jgi:hypothetical protein